MRLAKIILIAALLIPGLAQAEAKLSHRGECRKLTKQIARYEGVVDQARSRGNQLWKKSTQMQIERLASRRDRLCPDMDRANPARRAYRQAQEIVKMAAKTAIKYFTFGTF
jgi:hypothetical protein